MTRLLPLLLLAGCINAEPFELTITNSGDQPTFLAGGDSSGVLVGIQEQMGSTWVALSTNEYAFCMQQCGVPGAVACADMAAELGVVIGLMPDESATKAFDGEFWYVDPAANCVRQAPGTGALKATVCHSPDAQDSNTGDSIGPITEGGTYGQGGGASLVDAVCEEIEFSRSDPSIEVADPIPPGR